MNEPDKRPRKEVRSLDLWELVCWTYQRQKAHLYLRSNYDFFEWEVGEQDVRHELDVNVPVHHDAVRVHEAVRALGFISAQLIIEHAENGERPEPSTAHPEAYPVPARDEVMLAEDRSGWSMINGRRFSYVLRSQGTVREMEIVEPKPTKRRHKAVEQRMKAVRVEFCPIDWSPTPAYVDMVNAIYDRWLDAMCELLLSLEGAKLKNHLLTGFTFERGPSFDVPDYGPARQEQRAQLIRMDDTVGDLRTVDGAAQVVTMRRHVRVVLERPAA